MHRNTALLLSMMDMADFRIGYLLKGKLLEAKALDLLVMLLKLDVV